jgi:uncharacterized protein
MSIRSLKAPPKKATVEKARELLRRELVRTDAAYDRHIRSNNCKSDSCTTRCRYQERITTLQYALKLLGARGINNMTVTGEPRHITTIEEL